MTRSIDIMDLAARLVQRKAELGISMPSARLMNDGSVRTASKRALLRARDEVARSRGETIVFPAKY